MFIISEEANIVAKPVITQKPTSRKDWIRMECILQDAGVVNKNRRRYQKSVLEQGISSVLDRVKEGSFLGELDHPIDTRPARQMNVLLDAASHRMLDIGWDGNNVKAVIETLDVDKGWKLRNLAMQGIPVGWSFRGMGDIRQVTEGGQTIHDVVGPLITITWDAVSNPSHSIAKVLKITESVMQDTESYLSEMADVKFLHESTGIVEKKGMICTSEGVCYLPNEFDEFVNRRIIKLYDKYNQGF